MASPLKFGDQESIDRARNAHSAIDKMRMSFGSAQPGQLCEDCRYFVWSDIKSRCSIFERTNHTDRSWPEKAQGCGKFDKEE